MSRRNELVEGKFTIDTFAKNQKLTKQAALNKLSKLKKEGYVKVSGGGKQKRIYSISKIPKKKTQGFYKIVNKYSPEKLVPKFEHIVLEKYTVEHAIIDGIKIGDSRTKEATKYLFNQVKNWKRLFDLAKKKNLVKEVKELYLQARKITKTRKMPKKYLK